MFNSRYNNEKGKPMKSKLYYLKSRTSNTYLSKIADWNQLDSKDFPFINETFNESGYIENAAMFSKDELKHIQMKNLDVVPVPVGTQYNIKNQLTSLYFKNKDFSHIIETENKNEAAIFTKLELSKVKNGSLYQPRKVKYMDGTDVNPNDIVDTNDITASTMAKYGIIQHIPEYINDLIELVPATAPNEPYEPYIVTIPQFDITITDYDEFTTTNTAVYNINKAIYNEITKQLPSHVLFTDEDLFKLIDLINDDNDFTVAFDTDHHEGTFCASFRFNGQYLITLESQQELNLNFDELSMIKIFVPKSKPYVMQDIWAWAINSEDEAFDKLDNLPYFKLSFNQIKNIIKDTMSEIDIEDLNHSDSNSILDSILRNKITKEL